VEILSSTSFNFSHYFWNLYSLLNPFREIWSENIKNSKVHSILFYDGDCGLCQRSVAFLYAIDKNKSFYYAPLNGETFLETFKKESPMDTVLFFNEGHVYTKSKAIIEAIRSLGGVYRLAILLYFIPQFLRDQLYDYIAIHRKKVSCLILKKDERFLP